MPRLLRRLSPAVLLCALTLPLTAQEKGLWRASSTTARSITGDVAFGNDKFVLNLLSFTAPDITPDTLNNSTSLCGTYTYTR